ncbi:MAG TPA: hypothetical protein VHA52_02325 [Candidatus Babeliaceae bacterium]|nr:hypothetical protein [Candidatus Babeliaceae bacterium]
MSREYKSRADSAVTEVVELPPLAPTEEIKVHPKQKPNLHYLRDKDRQLVKGIFRFHEVPGGEMEFSFRGHKGDEVISYKGKDDGINQTPAMKDGQIYTVPLGVAKHLNKNLAYPIHGYAQDENGRPVMKVTQMVRRCSFQSLEFMDIEDLTPVGKPAV